MAHFYTEIEHWCPLRITGSDRFSYLQNLITNDVTPLESGAAVYAALLSPQGKILFDFFLKPDGEEIVVIAESSLVEDLLKRLTLYKLRADVAIRRDDPQIKVWAEWGEGVTPPNMDGAGPAGNMPLAFHDPRLPDAGRRLVAAGEPAQSYFEQSGAQMASLQAYDAFRLQLGLSDGSRDITMNKSTLLEANFDALNGVDFKKGCYVGQEVTARMKYRGLVRKRLLPMRIEGPPPEADAAIFFADREVGRMRSRAEAQGLALLRLEAVDQARAQDQPLNCGPTKLWPYYPAWLSAVLN